GELTRPRRRPTRDQPRDVRARDGEYADGQGQQHYDDGGIAARTPIEGLELRSGDQPATAIRLWIGARQVGGDVLHVGPRLREGESGLEAALDDKCRCGRIPTCQLVAREAAL